MDPVKFQSIIDNWSACTPEDRLLMKEHIISVTEQFEKIDNILLSFKKRRTSTDPIVQMIVSSRNATKKDDEQGWIVYDMNDIRKDPYWTTMNTPGVILDKYFYNYCSHCPHCARANA